jgi:hypothetical protein
MSFSSSVTLLSHLEDIQTRFVVKSADTLWFPAVSTIPYTFSIELQQITDRIVLENADGNRNIALHYPKALVNDNEPPALNNLRAEQGSRNSVEVKWGTDEFSIGKVQYGLQSDVHTATISDPLYAKSHEITLPHLASGTTYYYRVSSTDLSGNTATSQEQSFTFTIKIYLPLVTRN